MPEISIRGGLKKPAVPLGHPVPPVHPHVHPTVRMGVRTGERQQRVRKPRRSGRRMLGTALFVGGILLCGTGWVGLSPSERGWMLRLGDETTVMKPVCACSGHLPKLGSCARVGYLGAECAEWGGKLSLPLAAPLAGGLALAGLGAALMRRRKVEVNLEV